MSPRQAVTTHSPEELRLARIDRAARIVAYGQMTREPDGSIWIQSETTPTTWYHVHLTQDEALDDCTCPDDRGRSECGGCKHIFAARAMFAPLDQPPGAVTRDRLTTARQHALRASRDANLPTTYRKLFTAYAVLCRDVTVALMAETRQLPPAHAETVERERNWSEIAQMSDAYGPDWI